MVGIFYLQPGRVDTLFGVISTDSTDGVYTMLIDANATGRVQAILSTRPAHPAENIFANLALEPFKPPEE